MIYERYRISLNQNFNMKHFICFTIVFLFSVSFVKTEAQKLPNKQEASVLAPSQLKIDGKLSEWGADLNAFNRATEIYYTVANDEKNIYLAVRAKNRSIISRIINGGISFSVAANADKKAISPTITFPVYEPNKRPVLNISKDFYESSSTSTTITDSVMLVNNQSLERQSKLIFVAGVKGIDSLISVYNDNDIKVAQKFDNQMFYNYEMAVPLHYFAALLNTGSTINYHIVLNGASIFPENKTKLSDKIAVLGNVQNEIIAAKLGMEAQLNAATDFWGEYTLIKKS